MVNMRLTQKVFTDLAIWMLCFGFAIGLVFPFFVILLGVPADTAITMKFFMACVGAGLTAGCINFWMSRTVVGSRLRLLTTVGERMRTLAETMRGAPSVSLEKFFEWLGSEMPCGGGGCHVEVDSSDEIGQSAQTFNLLADTLQQTVTAERVAIAFSSMVSKHLDMTALCEQALRFWLKVFRAEAGLIAVVKEDDLELGASLHIRDPKFVKNSSHVAEALKSGKVIQTSAPEGISVDHVIGEHPAVHVNVVPILYKNTPLAAVVLVAGDALDKEDQRRLEMIRTPFAIALNNTMTHGHLRILASQDPLTGTYNRGFGLGRLREEYTRALRSETPLGVLMLDIDHFKNINDSFGHMVGDRVLKRITTTVKTILREGDVIVRYGGEEFLMVLPAAAGCDLFKIGDRLRRGVENLVFNEGEQSFNITVSIGGVSYPEMDVQSEEEMVRFADEALYRAKETGRNRIEIYSAASNAACPMARKRRRGSDSH